jgi:hypothetical protein
MTSSKHTAASGADESNYVNLTSTSLNFGNIEFTELGYSSSWQRQHDKDNVTMVSATYNSCYNSSTRMPNEVHKATDVNHNMTISSESVAPCRHRVRSRKQLKPRRCAPSDDPMFRGVIVRMATVFDGHSYKLLINSEFRLNVDPFTYVMSKAIVGG